MRSAGIPLSSRNFWIINRKSKRNVYFSRLLTANLLDTLDYECEESMDAKATVFITLNSAFKGRDKTFRKETC